MLLLRCSTHHLFIFGRQGNFCFICHKLYPSEDAYNRQKDEADMAAKKARELADQAAEAQQLVLATTECPQSDGALPLPPVANGTSVHSASAPDRPGAPAPAAATALASADSKESANDVHEMTVVDGAAGETTGVEAEAKGNADEAGDSDTYKSGEDRRSSRSGSTGSTSTHPIIPAKHKVEQKPSNSAVVTASAPASASAAAAAAAAAEALAARLLLIAREEDDKMVCCSECDRWVHASCEGIDDAQYKNIGKGTHPVWGAEYLCPPCRISLAERVADLLATLDASGLFAEPVSEDYAANYYDIIRNPMVRGRRISTYIDRYVFISNLSL
jgi:hypothetical protein